uniref:Uncharacterized protein n=1 Tax=viral metagenome TaxID=1070528 RepID=A0A6M3JAJ2_9ZZZZ
MLETVPDPAPGVPMFDSCMIDESASIIEVTIGSAVFRLRSVTAAEATQIWQRSKVATAPDKRPSATATENLIAQVDMATYMTLTVVAALGGMRDRPLGNEGWNFNQADGSPLPVTEFNVGRLIEAAIIELFREHRKFFRPERFGIEKSRADPNLEPGS